MALDTIEEGKQQYTLTCTDRETRQTVICQYNSSAILTTDYVELMQYAARMVVHHGKNKIYTISFVTPIHLCCGKLETGEVVSKQIGAIDIGINDR